MRRREKKRKEEKREMRRDEEENGEKLEGRREMRGMKIGFDEEGEPDRK